MGDGDVVDGQVLLAVVLGIAEVDVFGGADGDFQQVDAGEGDVEAGPSFKLI